MEEDDEPIDEKIARLTKELYDAFEEVTGCRVAYRKRWPSSMTSELRRRRSPRPRLPSGWIYEELGDLVESGEVSYGIVQPGSHDVVGVPILRVNNLRHGGITTDDVLRVSSEIEGKYVRTRLRGGEVLLSLVGSVGEVAIVPETLADWNVARAIAVIRPSGNVSARWLKYCLSSDLVQRHMRMWQTDTVQATLNLRDVRRLPIVMPPKSVRDAVAGLLGALDDKIESNLRLSRISAELAAACFRKAGKGEALLSEVATLTMGQSPPGETYNESRDGSPFYQGTRDFGFRYPQHRVWCTAPTRFAKRGDILLSVRAPVGTLNVATETCAIGRGLAAVASPSFPSVLYHSLAAESAVWEPYEAEGTVFGSINKAQLAAIRVPWPTPDAMTELEDLLSVLDEQVFLVERESRRLKALGDTLLPGLLSGELRIRDAEALVGEAV